MSQLDGLTTFVTGASQGIGQDIAVTMAGEGSNVALAARSDGIYETAEKIGDDSSVLTVKTDIRDPSSVQEAIEQTVDAFGGLDCLVNNAGIAGPTSPVEEVTLEEWKNTLDTNVTGMFLTVQEALPALRRSSRASIINISSISGKRPLPNRTPYATSKMAVVGLTRTLAHELGDDGITVNAISPGATRGERIERVIQRQADQAGVSYERARKSFTDHTALGTLVEPDDVSSLAVYLASEKGRHITCQDLNVDAGMTWY